MMKDLTHVLAAVKKERLKLDEGFNALSFGEKFKYLKGSVNVAVEAYNLDKDYIEALVHVASVAVATIQHLADESRESYSLPTDVEIFVKEGMYEGKPTKIVTSLHKFCPTRGYPVFECVVPAFDEYRFEAFLCRTIPPPHLQELNVLENIFKSAIEEFEVLKAEYKAKCRVLEGDSVDTVARKIMIYKRREQSYD